MRVPFQDFAAHHLPLEEALVADLRRLLRRGDFILGEEVAELERRFAGYCGTAHAVAVNSGTDALLLALAAAGIGPGDEVVTVANSFVATLAAILQRGAVPRFVDVGADMNLDPEQLEAALTPRTRAILPVHLGGRPAAMGEVRRLAAERGLVVIEDAAQAVGAEWQGRRSGSLGDLGCFSLHPFKVLGALGDGGMVTTDDERLAARLRRLRNHGLGPEGVTEWGWNSRLDTLQAAFLLTKLDHLEGWIGRRQAIAVHYDQRLAGVVETPPPAAGLRCVHQTYIVRCDHRDRLLARLAEAGVEARIHYPTPLHLQPAAAGLGYPAGSLPHTEALAGRILSLPIYAELSDAQVEFVADAVVRLHG